MNILILSGYDAESHIEWHRQLRQYFESLGHSVKLYVAPARHFSWRVRSNGIYFADSVPRNIRFDLLIATSMVDLVSLRGLRPDLTLVPSILYFHENQFAYPQSRDEHNLVHIQLTSLMGAMAADALVFNSSYNCESFFEGVETLSRRVPDTLDTNSRKDFEAKSSVIPIAIDNTWRTAHERSNTDDEIQVVWPHRWEYDKGTDLMAEVLRQSASQPRLKFAICGQQFKKSPKNFVAEVMSASERGQLVAQGHQPLERFRELLASSDIVLSTSDHEFQGLSMLRGIAAGACAVAPREMVYPEYVPANNCFERQTTTEKSASTIIELLLSDRLGYEPLAHCFSTQSHAQCWSQLISRIAISSKTY